MANVSHGSVTNSAKSKAATIIAGPMKLTLIFNFFSDIVGITLAIKKPQSARNEPATHGERRNSSFV